MLMPWQSAARAENSTGVIQDALSAICAFDTDDWPRESHWFHETNQPLQHQIWTQGNHKRQTIDYSHLRFGLMEITDHQMIDHCHIIFGPLMNYNTSNDQPLMNCKRQMINPCRITNAKLSTTAIIIFGPTGVTNAQRSHCHIIFGLSYVNSWQLQTSNDWPLQHQNSSNGTYYATSEFNS